MKKNKVLTSLFLLYPFIDLVTALQTRFFSFPITIGILIRGLIILVLFGYVVFNNNSKYRKLTITYFILLMVYGGIYFLTKLDTNIIKEVINLFKMFSLPTMLLLLLNFYDELGIDKTSLKRVLFINGYVFALLLFIAFITKTGNLTYPAKYHLDGYMGYFYAANEISAIAVILFPFMYEKISKSIFFKIVGLISGMIFLMIGTKTVLIGISITAIYYLIVSLINKKNRILYLVGMIFILVFAYFSPAYQNIVERHDRIENNMTINENTLLAYSTDDTSNKDIISSGRDEYLKDNNKVFKHSDLNEKLFGLGFTKYELRLVEMDLCDIFYRGGIVGLIIYLLPFIYVIAIVIKKIFKKINLNIANSYLSLGFALLLALLSGHVLVSPAVNIYIALVIMLLLIEHGYLNDIHQKKVIFVATTGGHLSEILVLKPLFKKYQTTLVTEKTKTTIDLVKKYPRVYYLAFGSDRHNIIIYGLRLLLNCFKSLYIYLITWPDVIVSTGAHFAGPMLCLGKELDSKVIFIETLANSNKRSATGNLVYQFADLFIVRWDEMLHLYPKAIKRGGIK